MEFQHKVPSIHQDYFRIVAHDRLESLRTRRNEDLVISTPDG
jgi:hypothetical protein